LDGSSLMYSWEKKLLELCSRLSLPYEQNVKFVVDFNLDAISKKKKTMCMISEYMTLLFPVVGVDTCKR
jgi:hypothetical protein